MAKEELLHFLQLPALRTYSNLFITFTRSPALNFMTVIMCGNLPAYCPVFPLGRQGLGLAGCCKKDVNISVLLIMITKKHWCLWLLLICAAPASLFGQVRVGPVGGASITRWIAEDNDDAPFYSSKYRSGYQAGIAANYWVNKRYSLHTEWLYLYRQKDVMYQRNLIRVHDVAKQHYLAVPALFRVSFHTNIKKSHQEWYVNAGPALHYWLGGSGRLRSNEQSPYLEEGALNYNIRFEKPGEYGATEYIVPANRWQMALYAGGGVMFDLGFRNHIFVDARTSLGLGKSYFATDAQGDFGLNLYQDNLRSSIQSLSVSAGFIRDFNMTEVLNKGKVKKKKKKNKNLKKNYGGKVSG